MSIAQGRWIEVAAPDAEAALALERRLAGAGGAAVETGSGWNVEVAECAWRLDEVVASVGVWLAERRLASAAVTVDGIRHVVRT